MNTRDSNINKRWLSEHIGGLPSLALFSPATEDERLAAKLLFRRQIDLSGVLERAKGMVVQNVRITGVPDGAVIRPGYKVGPQTWEVEDTENSFAELILAPEHTQKVDLELVVKVTDVVQQGANDSNWVTSFKEGVTVNGVSTNAFASDASGGELPATEILDDPPLASPDRSDKGITIRLGVCLSKNAFKLDLTRLARGPGYSIKLNDLDVATGAIDWSLGLPSLGGVNETPLFWQNITIPVESSTLNTSQMTICFEADETQSSHLGGEVLIFQWIDVLGTKIMPDEGYIEYPEGLFPASAQPGDGFVAWHGKMLINIAAIVAGDPDYGPPQEQGAELPSEDIQVDIQVESSQEESVDTDENGTTSDLAIEQQKRPFISLNDATIVKDGFFDVLVKEARGRVIFKHHRLRQAQQKGIQIRTDALERYINRALGGQAEVLRRKRQLQLQASRRAAPLLPVSREQGERIRKSLYTGTLVKSVELLQKA